MKKTFLIATLGLLCISALADEKRWGVVELSSIYMRIAPDYESALETQELMGTAVEIVGEKGYWRQIISPQPYKAWCTELGLVEMTEAEITDYIAAPKCVFKDLYGHIYSERNKKSMTICDLVGGDVMRIVEKKGKWTQVMLPSGKKGWVPSDKVLNISGFQNIKMGEDPGLDGNVVEDAINQAFTLLGSPYLWGGMTSKGVDCSGLVRWSYLMNGVLLPRNASQQIHCGEKVEMTYEPSFWKEENRIDEQGEFSSDFVTEMRKRTENLKRGDLVFFGTPAEGEKKQRVTHVGIYIGDGKIIHSSHKVRVNSLIPCSTNYYENSHRLLAAVRL